MQMQVGRKLTDASQLVNRGRYNEARGAFVWATDMGDEGHKSASQQVQRGKKGLG